MLIPSHIPIEAARARCSRRGLVSLWIALIAAFCTLQAFGADSGVPIPPGTWTQVLTHGLPVEAGGWIQLVYVPLLKQSMMLSKYHQRNSEPDESMVGYSFDTNSWYVLDMGGNFHTESIPEGGESQGYFGFDPSSGMIVYHCCTTGSNQSEDINHDWWYDVLGQSGRDKHTSPKPPAAVLLPGGTFDVAHNVFVFEGGASFVGTWAYDPVTNIWKQMFPGGTLPDKSLALPGLAYSTVEQKIYLFGGQSEADGTYNNDLYVYDYPTNTWTLVSPAGGVKPSGRTSHAFAYDSTNNIFLLYGGLNASGVLNDTWVYNPSTNAWTQVISAPTATNTAAYAKMSYDPDHNVFVLAQVGAGGGYYGGTWTTYGVQTWLFRYAGGGPNAGTQSSTPAAPPSGALNRYNTSWGKDPTLVSSGNSLYVGWSETSSPFDATNDAWPHIYVSQYTGGNWVPLGTSSTAISTDIFEAHAPSLGIVNGVPWVSYYQSSNTGQTAAVYSSSWDGSSTWNGGKVGLVGTGTLYQGQSQIVGVGSVPHVALLQNDRNVYPQRTLAWVMEWNGSAWATKGTALNQNTNAGDTALSVSLATDGVNPVAAWSEDIHTANPGDGYDHDSNPQIYVSQWNGSEWVLLGGSLNANTTSGWAYDPTIAYLNGTFYVAWVERSQSGNNQLYVKAWNGSTWTLVGSGALNRAPGAGWAFHPSLAADSVNNILYLGWVEQVASGQKAQVFLSRYSGGAWSNLGGALNADPVNGSAQRVSIGVWNGKPVAAWGEVNMGATRQVFVSQWTGSSWSLLPGQPVPDTTPPTTPGNFTATSVSSTEIDLAWSTATDTVGVLGYYVYRSNALVATVTSTLTYQDKGLPPGTGYCYTVAAFDGAGNVSAQSIAACAGISVDSISLSSTSVTGGTPVTLNTVSLNGPAPATGATVLLGSNNSHATPPASVTVAAGATTSPAFTITTTAVSSVTVAQISASYGGNTVYANLTLNPPAGPTVSVTAPPAGAMVSGTVPVTASASASQGVANVQFQLDGGNLGSPDTVSPYSINWDTTTAGNGSHTLTAIVTDNGGNKATSSPVMVTVSNTVTGPVVTALTLSPSSVLGGNPTMQNTVTLSGMAPSNGAAVSLSSDNPAATVPATVTVQAGATVSPMFTITTTGVTSNTNVTITASYGGAMVTATLTVTAPTGGSGPLLSLRGIAGEVSGVQNGAAVTPSLGPVGFNGTVVNNGGAVNFVNTGDGVSFQNCCGNSGNAYYKFSGTGVGSVFGAATGQISFTLTSNYSFTQRKTTAAGQRYAFDARDGNGAHLFTFMTQYVSPYLTFTWQTGGNGNTYFVPQGTEDALFGAGVSMQVTILWTASGSQLYLNGNLVSSRTAAAASANWSAASTFDLGAYEYLIYGGYDNCDDTIADLTVGAVAPTGSITAPAAGSMVSGTVPVTASASSVLGVASVQFQLDGSNLGGADSASPYSVNWNTTTASNGSHTLTAIVTDNGGNKVTSSPVMVTVNNAAPPTVSVTAPASGSMVSGTVPVTASATAGLGVASVQFQLDGSNLGSADTASPYSVNWNTTTASNGGHTLTAIVTDNGGNKVTSSPVTVTVNNAAPPTVSVTAPASGSMVSGTVPVTASATAGLGVASVQFQLDGNNLGSADTTSPYSINWDTTTASNASHTLTAIVTDNGGNKATSSPVTVTVSNTVAGPVVTALTLSPSSVLGGNPTTQNTVSLSGMAPAGGASISLSSDNPAATVPATVTVQAGATVSPAFTITTIGVTSNTGVTITASYGGAKVTATLTVDAPTGGSGPVLSLRGIAGEASGVQNGAVVTPTLGPVGFNGTVVNNGGAVNFASNGDGVSFQNCCGNSGNAYYKFTGTGVGSVFGTAKGQISFTLTSNYSFAQRKTTASGQRFAFDARDGNGSHLFSFMTQYVSPYLTFTWQAEGSGNTYFVPQGTEDALFGTGVSMQVTIVWTASGSQLYLNGNLVSSRTAAPASSNWSAASIFDLGAYEYLVYGGYDSCDDTIADFTVGPVPAPTVSLTSPAAGSMVSGTVAVTASASAALGVASVQFQLDGNNLGSADTASPYTINWNTTTATNNSHTLTAIVTDNGGNTATSSPITVTVNNANPPTVSVTAPAAGSMVSGTVQVTASASAGQGVASVQFQLDGSNLGSADTASPYSINWDTTTASNGSHTLTAIVTDSGGNKATSSPVTVTVNNTVGAVVTALTLSPSSVPGGSSTTQNTVTLSGMAPANGAIVSLSSNNPAATVPSTVTVQGGSTVSPMFTITTTSVTSNTNVTITASYGGAKVTATLTVTALLLSLQGVTAEVSGVQNGATVTPAAGPVGFNGTVVNNGGAVTFSGSGDGVSFTNCCGNSGNAYYHFTGSGVGSVFGAATGQVSFTLTSKYSFAQRKTTAAGQRYAFDVRDGNGAHLFTFMTQPVSQYLTFTWQAGGNGNTYFVPLGTEDALFGSGVSMQVTILWTASGSQLYLNGNLVSSRTSAAASANWSAGSIFDLGAYEYLVYGGYDSCDDAIADFTVGPHP